MTTMRTQYNVCLQYMYTGVRKLMNNNACICKNLNLTNSEELDQLTLVWVPETAVHGSRTFSLLPNAALFDSKAKDLQSRVHLEKVGICGSRCPHTVEKSVTCWTNDRSKSTNHAPSVHMQSETGY